jgi:hypothetical protein
VLLLLKPVVIQIKDVLIMDNVESRALVMVKLSRARVSYVQVQTVDVPQGVESAVIVSPRQI